MFYSAFGAVAFVVAEGVHCKHYGQARDRRNEEGACQLDAWTRKLGKSAPASTFICKPHLVVLNPIPNAARKSYSGLICYGDIQEVTLSTDLEFVDLPESVDKRYVDATIKVGEQSFLVPKLAALGVAFTYF